MFASSIKQALLVSLTLFFFSCNQESQWTGQKAIKKVSTINRPIQKQLKTTFDLGNGIYASNEFEGARLNGITRVNDSLISALITSENTPINNSAWYCFKLWSTDQKEIYLNLNYQEGGNHRYYPKLSKDGLNWHAIDSVNYAINESEMSSEDRPLPTSAMLKLTLDVDTLWVSAQELNNSYHVDEWIDKMAIPDYTEKTMVGKSTEGRDINSLTIGDPNSKKLIVVLSRQHPPEVTGYLAMQAFIETINSNHELAQQFRSMYTCYAFPLVNPDGVDNGHWRHNAGGIDLNRDWEDFNQIETRLVRDYIKNIVDSTGSTIYFAVDFHSTWEDIFYTLDPSLKGNKPGLIPAMIHGMEKEFENYTANIRPRPVEDSRVSSLSYFFYEYGAESMVYEIGDKTDREFVKEKGRVSALEMMRLLME